MLVSDSIHAELDASRLSADQLHRLQGILRATNDRGELPLMRPQGWRNPRPGAVPRFDDGRCIMIHTVAAGSDP